MKKDIGLLLFGQWELHSSDSGFVLRIKGEFIRFERGEDGKLFTDAWVSPELINCFRPMNPSVVTEGFFDTPERIVDSLELLFLFGNDLEAYNKFLKSVGSPTIHRQ